MTELEIKLCGHGSGTPSIKQSMYAYLENRYNQIALNGKRKGLVAVRRRKNMTDTLRTAFHDTYATIIGRNIYSQSLRNFVYKPFTNGSYYSDCSSSGCATYDKIGLTTSLLNTAGIYKSSLFEDVPVVIEKGHVTNPEVLQVGDALLFVGDDPERPLQIGHVEYIYEMPSEEPVKLGWIHVGDKWYYRIAEHTNAHGWYRIKNADGKTRNYHFQPNGEMDKGWLKIGDDWYYLEESGDLEGALYRSDENGVQSIWVVD